MKFPEDSAAAIWPPHEVFYIESLLIITRSGLSNIINVQKCHDRIGVGTEADKNEMLDSVQNIIRDGAALSRYFWPSSMKPLHQDRAAQLRAVFEISESSPLKERKLRNFIEHFDEKLDEYLAKAIVGTIIPSYVGPRYTRQQVKQHFFRAYFPQEYVFCVLSVEYDIKPIIGTLSALHNRLTSLIANGGRFQFIPKLEN